MVIRTANRFDNIEPLARAICAREIIHFPDTKIAELPALVDRFWPVAAAELYAGLRDDEGNRLAACMDGVAILDDWLDSR